MVRKFEFKKAYEEIEIDGKIYRFNTDDESLFKYQEELTTHGKKMTELSQRDDLEEKDIYEQNIALFKEILKLIFNQDCFDDIYAAAGKSLFGLIDLVDYLGDIIREKVSERQRKNLQAQQNQFSSKRSKGKNKRK